jgi:hypothetical protein
MNDFIQQMTERAENNTKLIYEIRKLYAIDVDYIFGATILGTQ